MSSDLRAVMVDVIQCDDVYTREAQEEMADAILALPEMQAIREVLGFLPTTEWQRLPESVQDWAFGGRVRRER